MNRIEILQRRKDYLQNKEHKNSYDESEIGSLFFAIEALRLVQADPQLKREVFAAVRAAKQKEDKP